MSSIAYFDCFAGAGGDMIVGSLLAAGADFEALKSHLGRLGVAGCRIDAQPVRRGGIAGTQFRVDVEPPSLHEHVHRGLSEILGMIAAANLPPRAARRAAAVFTRLGQAEAKVHGVAVEQVHFHEVGAADSIMDIVGACVALELLDVETVFCSPIPTGSGQVATEHGVLPVPAPATAELLIGAVTAQGGPTFECTTPTAAAVLTTLAKSYGPPPAMKIAAVGYGAGTRTDGVSPNLLRVLVGQAGADGDADSVTELAANIDDCSGELIGAAIENLLSAGCLDAWATPVYMKKSRPAWMLCALCEQADVEEAQRIIFSQTTTFGVRRRDCSRVKLRRRHQTVRTPYGPIRVKIGSRGDGEAALTASPEFGDCADAARSHHVSVREVMAAADAAFRRGDQT